MLIHLEYKPRVSEVDYSIYAYNQETVTTRIYSSSGSLLFEDEGKPKQGYCKGKINLVELPWGVYFLQFLWERREDLMTMNMGSGGGTASKSRTLKLIYTAESGLELKETRKTHPGFLFSYHNN